ncbi:MAG: protein kinase [Chromatiales bacterium]|jgi:serine/threonine-protein kinase|nr:protein kinase [Chromatiales bacterium]
MYPGEKPATGRLAAAGRTALLAGLAVLFVVGGSEVVPLETGYYDLLQRLAATPGRGDTVVVSTPDDPWTDPRLPALVGSLQAAGALAIVIAHPPPSSGADASAGPVARAGQATDIPVVGQALAEGARAMTSAGSVLLGLAAMPPMTGAGDAGDACRSAIDRGHAVPPVAQLPPTSERSLRPAAAVLCDAALAAGHLEIEADDDGVTRRLAPWLLAGGSPVPALALEAAALAGAPGRRPSADPLLLRYRAGSFERSALPEATLTEALAGTGAVVLRDHVVVVGVTAGTSPGAWRTTLGATVGPAQIVATAIDNLRAADAIRRPAESRWVELGLALLLGTALALAGTRLTLVTATVTAALAAVLLLTAEAAIFAAGYWLQLGSLAVFCLTGTAVAQGLRHLPVPGSSRPARAATAVPPAIGGGAELDLAFSVLRQQPTNGETKAQLYELAMEHGRRRDYARAERVFRHLAARDPAYRDVASKLERLSGARLAQARSASPAAPAAPAPATASPGPNLGRYQLERVIGRGAMATVYLGRDPTINRLVAIKTLPLAEEFAEDDLATARNHFLREAESAGRLNHPNIIAIYDAGEDEHVAWLAMEYFEGKPLSHYAQLGRLLPPATVVELMAWAAEALHYAHAQNVVHRDVKPANLLYDEVADTLKLVDFGIARLTDSSRTRTGIILGTPSYMSPEQLAASRVSGQSDLYSLGVTMYHLLAGAPPFQADTVPKLMERISQQPHRPLRDIRDDIPPCVDEILDRALAKNPSDRFPDGRAMARALRACCRTLAAVPA